MQFISESLTHRVNITLMEKFGSERVGFYRDNFDFCMNKLERGIFQI